VAAAPFASHIAFALVAAIRVDVLFLLVNIIRILQDLIVGTLSGDIRPAAGRSLRPITSRLLTARRCRIIPIVLPRCVRHRYTPFSSHFVKAAEEQGASRSIVNR
jgi:hypothetical protein